MQNPFMLTQFFFLPNPAVSCVMYDSDLST